MSKDLIVKGNKLIEAKYKLTTTQTRLFLKMVSVIKKEHTEFYSYRFSVQDLLHEFSMHPRDHREIKKATYGLFKKVLLIKDEERNRELQISLISSAEYVDSQGVVELSFDPKLKPYLLQLQKNFTSFQFSTVKRLRSSYTLRIYELAKQYEKIGIRHLQLEELKQILGIPPHQYNHYGHFKKRVLQPAQKEINKHTELMLEIEEIKMGRRVEELVFHITSEMKKAPVVQNLDELTKRKQWNK